MRFICPELIKENQSSYVNELFKSTVRNNEAEQDTSGKNMPKVSTIKVDNTKPTYVYGTTDLYYLYQSYDYDDTAGRTIADLSSDIDATITNYTDLSTEGFTFQFQNFLDKKKPFKSSFWWTIITDAGLMFVKPERQSASNQIATFVKVGDNMRSSDLDNVSYQGETGADFYVSANVDQVVPDKLDNTFKTMTLNKFKSSNHVIIIRSNYNAVPLDYVVSDNETFLIVSKKQLTQDGNPLYEYMCIKEVKDTYTLVSTDQEPPVHPLIGESAGGSVALNDLTDVTITSVADRNLLIYDNISSKWINNKSLTKVEANRSTAQTFANNANVTVIYNNETTDTLNEYNNATGIYVPATNKTARFDAVIIFTTINSGSIFRFSLNNGGTILYDVDYISNNANLSLAISWEVDVLTTGSYKVVVRQISGASINSLAGVSAFVQLKIKESLF